MTPFSQALLMTIGVLLTALTTVSVSTLSGMRGDIKDMLKRMDEEAEARQDLSERLLVLETEHKNRHCWGEK